MLLSRFYDGVDRKLARSAGETLRQTQNLIRTRDAVIFGLAKLADSRDPDTGDHLERISAYCTVLASALRRYPKFRDQVTPGFIRLIGISSALHDIGKVGIEDSILLQPGPLSPTQRARMQKHSTVGGKCLTEIEQRLGSSNFLQMAREIALAHHERWDGTGYPNGLAGDAIPVSARIAAVADVYDALSSKRVYKDALPHEECVAIITGEAGKQFDPDVVEIWLSVESKYRSIARQYADPVPQAPEDVSGETVWEAEQREEQECLVSSAAGE
jgi:response regulator RpfG family c-di-GMP phosphodiesterase